MHIRYFLFEMKAERGGRPGGDDAGDDVERLDLRLALIRPF